MYAPSFRGPKKRHDEIGANRRMYKRDLRTTDIDIGPNAGRRQGRFFTYLDLNFI